MKKEILAQFNSPDLVLTAFMLFLFTFIGVALWTYRKSGRKHYQKMSKFPFQSSSRGDVA